MPGPTAPAKVLSLHWDTFAHGCDVAFQPTPIERSICYLDDLAPPGFALYIARDGERTCPSDPNNVFTERHVFYQGVEDNRQCSACTCGAPTGSTCTATIAIYKGADLTCTGPTVTQTTINSAGPVCFDIALPGQALESKSAGATTYLPAPARRRAVMRAVARSRPTRLRSAAAP